MVQGDHIELTFLSGNRPLTKQISATNVIPYPHLRDLTSNVKLVSTIREFGSAIQTHASNGEALLIGRLTRQIKEASRSGLVDKQALARWLCLDFDGLPGYSPASALQELEKICPGISSTSHLIQYSSSSRLFKSAELRCHIFFLLDEAISPLQLRNWFLHANVSTAFIKFVTLTPSKIALHYPIDPALAEQTRLVFIATPVFTPASLDPHPNDRLQLVEGAHSELNTTQMMTALPSYDELQKKLLDCSNALRKQTGLGHKKLQTAFKNDFCNNPDACEVTGIKHDRGYVYLNLNNGDSWGYWYPDNDPTILYNFKGEPSYPLEKIVPDYWNMYIAPATVSSNPSGPGTLHFAFQNDYSGKIHTCIYNSHTAQLNISAALSDTAARRWLVSHKQNPKFFHVVTTFYDPRPAALMGVDLRLRTINTYEPSELKPATEPVNSIPSTIDTIIRHALNQPDPNPLVSREYEHFLNWLAFIVQSREHTGTAWLLHGTTGTGKGVIIQDILGPIVGATNLSLINMKTMAERFTNMLDDKIIVGLDEIKREDFNKHPGLMNQIKNIITEKMVTSRKFQGAPKKVPNYANYILTSNEQVPMEIPADDRRFNVAFGQPRPLRVQFDGDQEKVDQAIRVTVPSELSRFMKFLLTRKVSRSAINITIDNKAKRNMVAAGRTATQSFFDLIRMSNNLAFLEEYQRLQHGESVASTIMENQTIVSSSTIKQYLEFCEKFLVPNITGPMVITREQMSILARIMLGRKIPMTPQRYISWLSQFGITEQTVRCSVRKVKTKGVVMECQTN